MPQIWVLLVLVLGAAETAGPTAGGAVTGMAGAPAMQEFQSEAACRRAGEAMVGLLGFAGWGAAWRSVRVRWTCVPK